VPYSVGDSVSFNGAIGYVRDISGDSVSVKIAGHDAIEAHPDDLRPRSKADLIHAQVAAGTWDDNMMRVWTPSKMLKDGILCTFVRQFTREYNLDFNGRYTGAKLAEEVGPNPPRRYREHLKKMGVIG